MLGSNLLYKKKSQTAGLVFSLDFEGDFVDKSPNAYSVTNTGVTLASSPAMQGASSALFATTNVTPATTYLRTDTSSWGLAPFQNDWTIEFYFYNLKQGNFGQTVAFTIGNHYIDGYALYVTGRSQKLGLYYSLGANDNHISIIGATNGFNLNTKYHGAFVKKGNVFTIYQNGVANGSATLNTSAFTLNSNILTIGCISEKTDGSLTEFPWIGNLDNFKIYNYARYSANFTPDA